MSAETVTGSSARARTAVDPLRPLRAGVGASLENKDCRCVRLAGYTLPGSEWARKPIVVPWLECGGGQIDQREQSSNNAQSSYYGRFACRPFGIMACRGYLLHRGSESVSGQGGRDEVSRVSRRQKRLPVEGSSRALLTRISDAKAFVFVTKVGWRSDELAGRCRPAKATDGCGEVDEGRWARRHVRNRGLPERLRTGTL
jgi:hypothetical protein